MKVKRNSILLIIFYSFYLFGNNLSCKVINLITSDKNFKNFISKLNIEKINSKYNIVFYENDKIFIYPIKKMTNLTITYYDENHIKTIIYKYSKHYYVVSKDRNIQIGDLIVYYDYKEKRLKITIISKIDKYDYFDIYYRKMNVFSKNYIFKICPLSNWKEILLLANIERNIVQR